MGQGTEKRGSEASSGAEAASLPAPPSSSPARLTAALLAIMVATSAMNIAVFPLFDAVLPVARDVSISASALVLLLMGLAATWRPRLLHARALGIACPVALVLGAPALLAALAWQSPAALAASATLLAVARAWVLVVVGVAMARLPREQGRRGAAIAFATWSLATASLWALPTFAGMACFLTLPVAAHAFAWPVAAPLLQRTEVSEAPADFSATQPATFIPLISRFFGCLFLFRVAFGYALRFSASPLSDAAAAVPVLVCCAYMMALRRRFPADFITRCAVLLIVAGFLFGGVAPLVHPAWGAAALTAGNALFDIVAWAVLITTAARNERAAVAVIAWGRGVTAAGSVVGAFLGVTASRFADPETLWLFSSLVALGIVAFALFALSGYSFELRAEEVVPVVDEAAALPEIDFEERCRQLAAEYGLTPRETQVFALLARGRDRAHIEEALTISRNTVKAHVKHIYAKLDVHAHQELIDLVENNVAPDAGELKRM